MTRIISILIGGLFILAPLNSHAMPKLWRKVCGKVLSVNQQERTLTLMSTKSSTPLELRLTDSTIYISDHHRVEPEKLAIGTFVTLFYKNPLFSSRFATRVVWETFEASNKPKQGKECLQS